MTEQNKEKKISDSQKKIKKNQHRIKLLLEQIKNLSRKIEECLHWREENHCRMKREKIEEFRNYAMLVDNNSKTIAKECNTLVVCEPVYNEQSQMEAQEIVLEKQNRILALLHMNLLYKEHILGMVV